MCGIVGEVFFQKDAVSDRWVRTASQIMAHRGPDGTGLYCDGRIVLGHRRLAIIDLSGGHQPMSYTDGRYWITFNGEIYNYRHLKQELAVAGYSFSTSSDTETILAAYAVWGIGCFRRLDGIFAFAIWDREEETLVIVRDHLGVKPVLYHVGAEGVQFSSELKALLTHPQISHDIDPNALQDYLNLGYVLNPRTLIKGLFKLPPGNYLRVQGEHVEQKCYWDMAAVCNREPVVRADEAQIVQEFDERLSEVVGAQMISDVPLGAFLSGGIDSSSIVYHAAQHNSNPLKTFSIGFDEASYSELNYASDAASHLHNDYYQQIVKAPTFEELGKLVWYYDEPLGDTSIIPTYFVSKLAREHVTVVLSGDGGDELLAGYDTYRADQMQALYAHVPGWIHHKLIQPLASLIPSSYRKVSWDFKIKQFIQYAYAAPEAAHYNWRRMFNDSEQSALSGNNPANGYSSYETYRRYYAEVPEAPALTRSLYVDIKTWLVDDILTKVDRASMACSLESRVPFLAPSFVEYALQLPPNLKIKGLTQKYILKQALRRRLPRNIVYRKKRGFNAPVSIWMRDCWKTEIDDLFRSCTSTLVDLKAPLIQRLWDEHTVERIDHGFKLWTLLSLILWEREVYHGCQQH